VAVETTKGGLNRVFCHPYPTATRRPGNQTVR
jgi:hypothetical protein